MLDFDRLRSGAATIQDLTAALRPADLHALIDESLDAALAMLADADDAALVFEPVDPDAADGAETGWTAAHVVAHMTASAEETAALAATLARGIPLAGRSRFEVPWETLGSRAAVERRVAESRRMRHAFVEAWPDTPDLELSATLVPSFGPMNAQAIFALGLVHEDGHLRQLREVLGQSRAPIAAE